MNNIILIAVLLSTSTIATAQQPSSPTNSYFGAISGSTTSLTLDASSTIGHESIGPSTASAKIVSGGNATNTGTLSNKGQDTSFSSTAKSLSHTSGSVHTTGNSNASIGSNNTTGAGNFGIFGNNIPNQ